MADFLEEPAFEIGRRIEIRESFAWFVVIKPEDEPEIAKEDFVADLSAVLAQPVRIVSGSATPEGIRAGLMEPDSDPVLITGLDGADEVQWRAWDVNRSGFIRPGPVIFWLSSAALTRLCLYAPNIRSFVGGSIFCLGSNGGEMTESERQQRISDLEIHFQMTATEVVRRAELGTLPTEPHFVEWLVLLGRGDLV